MPITTKNRDYTENIGIVEWIRPLLKGQWWVKKLTKQYLYGFQYEDIKRYKMYLLRAIYTNYVGFTHKGFLDMIFRVNPSFDLPKSIEYLKENANGKGHGLVQFTRQLTSETLAVGNCGLYVTYPKTLPGTRKKKDDSLYQARMTMYRIEARDNIEVSEVNGVFRISMVKLKENHPIKIDSFTKKDQTIYRVLKLDSKGMFYYRLVNEKDEILETKYPLDYNGNKFDHIPFYPICAEVNDEKIDVPPLADIANVNVGHFNNSGDLEEMAHKVGQGTLFVNTKMTSTQWKQLNGGKGVSMGADSAHNLGEGGSAQILQPNERQILLTLRTDKKEEMISLGAKYIEESSNVKTATGALIDADERTSGLGTLSQNVGMVVNQALLDVQRYMSSVVDPDVKIKMNTDFYDKKLTPQQVMSAILLKDNEVISLTDLREAIRGSEYLDADRTDDQIESDISNGE